MKVILGKGPVDEQPQREHDNESADHECESERAGVDRFDAFLLTEEDRRGLIAPDDSRAGHRRPRAGPVGPEERDHREHAPMIVGGLGETQLGHDAADVLLDSPLGDP